MSDATAHVTPLAWLEAHGAQRDVLDGLRAFAADWPTLWRTCPRGDWLLGIAERIGAPHRDIARAAIACARTAHDHFEGEEPARVLDLVARWAEGEALDDAITNAARELEAAIDRGASGPSADAAGRAALAVGLGVTPSERGVLVSAPAFAAEAMLYATIDCGLEMAMGWAHRACADAVRTAIPWDSVARLVVAGR